jgi:hypothetical protein
MEKQKMEKQRWEETEKRRDEEILVAMNFFCASFCGHGDG